MREDRTEMGSLTQVPDMRACRLLRLIGWPPRRQSLQNDRPRRNAGARRRGLEVVLRRPRIRVTDRPRDAHVEDVLSPMPVVAVRFVY